MAGFRLAITSHAYTTVLPATIQSIRRSWEEQKAITEIIIWRKTARAVAYTVGALIAHVKRPERVA